MPSGVSRSPVGFCIRKAMTQVRLRCAVRAESSLFVHAVPLMFTLDGDPFCGHMQTVLTQYRRHKVRRLIRVYIVCLQEFICKIQFKLEKVFVKHYAPNCMPEPKRECSLLKNVDGNNSEVHKSIYSSSSICRQRSNAFQGIFLTSLKC